MLSSPTTVRSELGVTIFTSSRRKLLADFGVFIDDDFGAGLRVRDERRGNGIFVDVGGEGGGETELIVIAGGAGEDSFRRLAGLGPAVGEGVGRAFTAGAALEGE